MIVLSDNDIILKLAAFNSLEAAIEIFEVPPEEVRVLDSARHVLRKNKRIRQRFGEEITERALAFVERATPLEDRAAYDAEAEMLRDIERIDEGEQVLFASTREFEEFDLLTGDKRALRALAAAPQARPVFDRLRGHVICLEEVTRVLIIREGFEKMRAKIVPHRECDMAIKAAFGSGMKAQSATVLEVLNIYFRNLEIGDAEENGVGTGWLKRLTPVSQPPIILTVLD